MVLRARNRRLFADPDEAHGPPAQVRYFCGVGQEFVPKLFTTLRTGYTRHQFGRDLTAGIIVGIVALPLAIAFAIASGVPPERA